MKTLSRLYVGLIIFFLYAPVLVMIAFSFNDSSSVWVFTGFSLKWYAGLASDTTMLTALLHTIIIAVLSAVISTVLGTAAAVGIMALRKKITQKFSHFQCIHKVAQTSPPPYPSTFSSLQKGTPGLLWWSSG